MRRKIVSLVVGAAMALSMVACGTQNPEQPVAQTAGERVADSSNGGGSAISILNSKTEIQTQFEDMAKEYEEKTGVHVEVYNADTDTTVASQIATKYASHDPYTLSMVDPKDIYAVANEYAYDLSNEDWAKKTKLGITVDGKRAVYDPYRDKSFLRHIFDRHGSDHGCTFACDASDIVVISFPSKIHC